MGRTNSFGHLQKNGVFTVKSFYYAMKLHDSRYPFKKIYRFKVPIKIKVFIWQALKK